MTDKEYEKYEGLPLFDAAYENELERRRTILEDLKDQQAEKKEAAISDREKQAKSPKAVANTVRYHLDEQEKRLQKGSKSSGMELLGFRGPED